MNSEEHITLAGALPAWKVFQRFYPGVEITSTQAGPEAPEELHFPEGFEPPSEARMWALKLELAGEILGARYRDARSAEYLPAGDTLDGVLKGFEALQEQGTVLPEDTLRVITHWREVKTRHPKPQTQGEADAPDADPAGPQAGPQPQES